VIDFTLSKETYELNVSCTQFNIKLRYATFGSEPKEKGVLKTPFFNAFNNLDQHK